MSDIIFCYAKNNQLTCSVNQYNLHSRYNPEKESENFVASLHIDFKPTIIIIIEPALSYCVPYLRRKFPGIPLCAIRFTHDFDKYNFLWDIVIYSGHEPQLLYKIGEEKILGAFYISWKPSQSAFPEIHKKTHNAVTQLIIQARDIIATRAYFGLRWLKNTFRFCIFTRQTMCIHPGTQPVVIAASGPSLKPSIPYIKQYRNNFFLIAVSSAYSPLAATGIFPDICISTDGGYWAKRHIEHCKIPLAAASESAIPKELFSCIPVIPLEYHDGPQADLLRLCQFTTQKAIRNGTVSGTAVELALSITHGNIFFCGLDLEPAAGYQHTQPNELELITSEQDNRTAPKEQRLTPGQFSDSALSIYRDWFSAQSDIFSNRVYRVSDTKTVYRHRIDSLPHITWDTALQKLGSTPDNQRIILCPTEIHFNPRQRYHLIEDYITSIKSNIPESWMNQLFPAELLLQQRSTTESYTASRQFDKKVSEVFSEIQKFLISLGKCT